MKKGIKNLTLAGSPCWMAPEVMLKTGHDTKADVWSLGITALELALGQAPNSNFDYGKVMMLILKGSPPSLPDDGTWSEPFQKFVEACLKKIPDERPTISDLVRDHQAFLGLAQDKDFLV